MARLANDGRSSQSHDSFRTDNAALGESSRHDAFGSTLRTRVLSPLTQEVFGLLAKGTDGHTLLARMEQASTGDLLIFQQDVRVYSTHTLTLADADARKTFESLVEMAESVLDGRKPSALLLKQILEHLNRGTNQTEMLALLNRGSDAQLADLPERLAVVSTNLSQRLQSDDAKNVLGFLGWITQASRGIVLERKPKPQSTPAIAAPERKAAHAVVTAKAAKASFGWLMPSVGAVGLLLAGWLVYTFVR
jgi:hypothetical protein